VRRRVRPLGKQFVGTLWSRLEASSRRAGGDSRVGVYQEFARTGELSDDLAELLYRTVRVIGTSRNFPAPGGRTWADNEAVWETAHDFLYTAEGKSRIAAVFVAATDQRSFERVLDKAVHNFLRGQARKTDIGKLVLRLNEVAAADPTLEVAGTEPRRWCLKGGPSSPGAATSSAFAAALSGVEVVVPAWSSETRDAPVADRPSVLAMIHALLEVAGGSLSAVDMAHAITTRLDTRRVLPTTSLEEVMELGIEPADDGLRPDEAAAVTASALAVMSTMDDVERVVTANRDATVRKLGEILGVSKSKAAKVRAALEEKLTESLLGQDEPEVILGLLDLLCSHWCREWTSGSVPTSRNVVSAKTETGGL